MRYAGPLLDITDVTDTTSGASRAYPSDSDQTSTGEIVPENGQVTAEDIPAGSVVLGAFKFSSRIIKGSFELAQDAGVDFDGYIAGRLGVRLGRIMNAKFSTGVGTVEPFGVATQATLGASAIGSSGNTGGSDGTNTIGTTDLATLVGSVDSAYYSNARFMVHPATLASLRACVSKAGLPVFPGLNYAGEDSLFGFSVSVNPWLDTLQTNPSSPAVTRKTVLFGDFRRYRVRRAPLIVMRLPTRFADTGQIGFLAFWRADGAICDGSGGSIKCLVNQY
jgi:HK97 family phage major capsid protein